MSDSVLDYAWNAASRHGRWRWPLAIALAVVLALAAVTVRHAWLHMPGSNLGHRYPGMLGVDPSLEELRQAVIEFAVAHDGALPNGMADVKPYLPTLSPLWNRRVTPDALLPHVKIVGLNGPIPLRFGEGRFILLVRVLQSGPMHDDVVLVLGETAFVYQHSDAQIISALGQVEYDELKKASYRLP